MAFTQPCFIRKNTPELRQRLVDLGYNRYPIWMTNWKDDNYVYLVIDGIFYKFPSNLLDDKQDNLIDCGTNEELFLAIAALRDDNDKEQWFITYKSSHPYMDYAAILCRENKWEDEYIKESQQHNFIYTKPEDYHKANVKEIIRIYTDDDEELNDLYKD